MKQAEAIRKAEARVKAVVGVLVLYVAQASAQQELAAPGATAEVFSPSSVVRQVVVSIPDRKLALMENGVVKRVYPVAVGKPSTPSPVGTFKVVTRVSNPTYYHPGKVVPAGASNPVGTRWIGLSERGFGIHGTNVPRSIGKAASHGCVRMAKADIEELFEIVRPGDEVRIVGERDELTARLFGTPASGTLMASAAPATAAGGQQ